MVHVEPNQDSLSPRPRGSCQRASYPRAYGSPSPVLQLLLLQKDTEEERKKRNRERRRRRKKERIKRSGCSTS